MACSIRGGCTPVCERGAVRDEVASIALFGAIPRLGNRRETLVTLMEFAVRGGGEESPLQ